jgi:hypothetical protein
LIVERGPEEDKTMFNFEKLEVWRKAIDFADLVYRETCGFPADERFGLNSQPSTSP